MLVIHRSVHLFLSLSRLGTVAPPAHVSPSSRDCRTHLITLPTHVALAQVMLIRHRVLDRRETGQFVERFPTW